MNYEGTLISDSKHNIKHCVLFCYCKRQKGIEWKIEN